MRRAYISLQKKLHPDTLYFLGDLFDGGREWKTAHGNSEDPAWANGQRPSAEKKMVDTWGKRYGEDYWLQEYNRFGRIFYGHWNVAGATAGAWQRGRKVISSLPGNHDLGFGAAIKLPIRNRFETYFGEGNRVDVIGNHTFVSVDAVSLSAEGDSVDTKAITAPSDAFLAAIQAAKRKAVAREIRFQNGMSEGTSNAHKVEELEKADFTSQKEKHHEEVAHTPDLPTILLTHVPLYRPPGTPCGPKREKYPPIPLPEGQTTPVIPDDRNALSIAKGWQYQNVLGDQDSISLIKKIGNVRHVFSGDDHDYCEVFHDDQKENVKEITVKSMSWAMGVRKPGFLLLSLWNPLDADGLPLQVTKDPRASMQTHLCLLPDQIGILIRYGVLVFITITTLIVRAMLMPRLNLTPFSASSDPYAASKQEDSFLPTQRNYSSRLPGSSTSSTSSNNSANMRGATSRARAGSSPANGYGYQGGQPQNGYGRPLSEAGTYSVKGMSQFEKELAERYEGDSGDKRRREVRQETVVQRIFREAWQSVWRTTWVVVVVFLYLCRYN